MIPSQKNKLGRVDLYVTAMSFGGVAIGNLSRPVWRVGIRCHDSEGLGCRGPLL